jgi:hypothetical protein
VRTCTTHSAYLYYSQCVLVLLTVRTCTTHSAYLYHSQCVLVLTVRTCTSHSAHLSYSQCALVLLTVRTCTTHSAHLYSQCAITRKVMTHRADNTGLESRAVVVINGHKQELRTRTAHGGSIHEVKGNTRQVRKTKAF